MQHDLSRSAREDHEIPWPLQHCCFDMEPDRLLEPAAVLLATPSLSAAIAGIADLLRRRVALLRMGVAIVEPDQPWLRVIDVHGDGEGPASNGGARMPMLGTANGQVARSGEPHVNTALDERAEFLEERTLRQAGARAYYCFPARFGEAVVGTLNVALKEAAHDPCRWLAELRDLAELLGAALERDRLQREVQRLNEALRRRGVALDAELERVGAIEPVAKSEAFRRTITEVERVAVADVTVLLLGPTGCGKEVVARHLHRMSPRAEGPFVPVNCAALPEGLVESELFGVKRGAFTGADRDRAGLFEQAHGGTLFLDEIGELGAAVQSKLLRVLQDHVITPIGAERSRAIDVRVVAATNRDLHALVAEGRFRADLLHRITTIPIRVPALAERSADIPELVRHFVRSACVRLGRAVPEIDAGVLRALAAREYSGNVRELRNVVERGLLFSGERFMLADRDLPSVGGDTRAVSGWPTLADAQLAHIAVTLRETKGRVYGRGGAAELLGLPPSTLKSRMKRLAPAVTETS